MTCERRSCYNKGGREGKRKIVYYLKFICYKDEIVVVGVYGNVYFLIGRYMPDFG